MRAHADFMLMQRRILRRVDTIRYPSPERIRREVSVDLDLHASDRPVSYADLERLRRRFAGEELDLATDWGEEEQQALLVVPVAVAHKEVWVGLDLRDASDGRIPAATSSQNKTWARAVVLGAVLVEGGSQADLDRVDRKMDALLSLGDDRGLDAQGDAVGDGRGRSVASDDRVLRGFEQERDLVQWLCRIFAHSFALLALVSADGPERRIVKYGSELKQEPPRRRVLLDDLSGSPYSIRYAMADAYTQDSFHIELHAPDGVEIAGAGVYPLAKDQSDDREKREVLVPVRRNVTRSVVHFMGPSTAEPDCELVVDFVPANSLVWGVGAVGLLVFAFAWLANSSASVDALWAPATIVTGAAGLLAYQGRHRIAKRATMAYRAAALAGIVPLILFVLASAFDHDAHWSVPALQVATGLSAGVSLWMTTALLLRSCWRLARRKVWMRASPQGDEVC